MRDTLTSPRVEDMKRKRHYYHIRLSILLFILFISFIGALGYFSSHPRIIIKNIVISGTRIINPVDVESLVKNDLLGRYVFLFAKVNSLIYPHEKIYKDILNQFPRIETLSIYHDNLITLHVAITERSGSYLYCGQGVPEAFFDIGENCYFINDDGYIFDKSPYFSGNVYFKYYMELSSGVSVNPLGLQMLPKDRFHEISRFIDRITMLGFKPIYLVIDKDGTNTIYLNHDINPNIPKIIFKNNNDLDLILSNLSVSMAKKEFANEINGNYDNLLYIDLRFNNKVVYKFQ